jgi:hypothetical protein
LASLFSDRLLEAAGLGDDKRGPLFRPALRKTGTLNAKRLSRVDAWRMVKKRALEAEIVNVVVASAVKTYAASLF